MALEAKIVTFTPVDAVPPTTQAITGVGFQPKAIIFFYGGSASVVDQDVSVDAHSGMGFAVSPTQRGCFGAAIEDAVGTMNTAVSIRTDCCILQAPTAGGATDGRWDLQSMDVDGFTLVVDQGGPALAPRRVTALCLGGTDITDVFAGVFTGAGAVGNQDISGVGFQPDIVFFAHTGQAGPLPTFDDDVAARYGFGVGKSAAEQACLWSMSEDASANSIDSKYANRTDCIFMVSNTGVAHRADYVTGLPDGFRIDWNNATLALPVLFLAIKGGSWRVDDALTATSITTVVESGFGFTPKGVLVASHYDTAFNAGTTTSANFSLSVGAADGAAEVAHTTHENNGLATSNSWVDIQYDEVYVSHSNTAVTGTMGVQSLNADGITFNQTDADPTQRVFWYVACGDTPPVAELPPLALLGVGA
jgi:hypothetical protein